MTSAGRRASTDELLARIDDVVSGHELQRTYEPPVVPAQLALASMRWQHASIIGSFHAVGEMIARAEARMREQTFRAMVEFVHSPTFARLVAIARKQSRLPPVPAKAAHRHRYGRGS